MWLDAATYAECHDAADADGWSGDPHPGRHRDPERVRRTVG